MTREGGRLRLFGAALVVTVVTVCLFGTGTPGRAAPQRAPERNDETALKLLKDASHAAQDRPYRGEQFVSAWSGSGTVTSVVEVAHDPGHGMTMKIRGTGSDPAGASYAVDTPGQKRAPTGGLFGPSPEQLSLLRRNYTVHQDAGGAVAGRDAQVVEVRRTDRSVAARFWIDTDEHLLLRRELFDGRGRIVRASAFIELDLVDVDVTGSGSGAHRPWGDELGGTELSKLRTAGWNLPGSLPDGLTLYDARRGREGARGVLHLGYSDGLSAVSVFVQRGRLDEERLRGWQRVERNRRVLYTQGTVQHRLTWAARGYVYTVVADAPMATTRRVVAAFPHESHPGFWTRIADGLSRVAAWVNPLS